MTRTLLPIAQGGVTMEGDDESRIAAFLGRYEPAIESQLSEARWRLRSLFPRGHELVFDNYNALVLGISPTDRAAGARR